MASNKENVLPLTLGKGTSHGLSNSTSATTSLSSLARHGSNVSQFSRRDYHTGTLNSSASTGNFRSSVTALNSTNQFKYTSIWNEYIALLKNNVPLRRHRVGLRYYDNTFSGAEAVQTILAHVKSRPDLFSENTNRRNLTRLCNKLLERGVLEKATYESDGTSTISSSGPQPFAERFSDSKDIFYRISPSYTDDSVASCAASGVDLSEVNLSKLERDCIRESVRVRLLQLLDINFIDNIVSSPAGKGQANPDSSSLLIAITNKFTQSKEDKQLATQSAGFDHIEWNEDLRSKFNTLVEQSTFDSTDPVLSRGLNLMHDHLIGRNPGLFNALTRFYRHTNSHHQGIELYKLITEYYKHCHLQYSKSLISSKWDEVIRAIGRLMEQIKRIELQNVNDALNLNASICSFSSTGTATSLVTSQKEVVEASQLFFQLIPENHRNEIKSLLSFLRVCSCASGHLSIDGILLDYVNILFNSSGWQQPTYRIPDTGEYFNYAGQIINLWIENHDTLIEMPAELSRQIKLKFELIKKGQLSPCAPDYKFCQQLSKEEYQEQKLHGTKNELEALMRNIEESAMPQRKKDKLLEQFRTMHGLNN